MARNFVAASSQYASVASVPAGAAPEPVSIACWFRVPSITGGGRGLVSLGLAGISVNYRLLLINTVGNLVARSRDGASNADATTTAACSANVWSHAAAVFATTSDRRAFLNGGNKGTNTTTKTPSLPDSIYVGSIPTPGGFHDGDLAEIAIWSIALTDGEVASLAAGISPLRVRPQNLIWYPPFLGVNSPEPEFIGRNNLTLTNAPIQTDHPRIIRLAPLWIPSLVAAGGAFTLTADPGSLAITGTAATLLVTRRLGADAGSLAITGTDANLLVVRRLSADPGAFAITGTAVDFELTTHADAGEVLITGTGAQLLVVAKLVADAGSVAITGTDAALLVTRRLAADTGAVLITGTDATFPVTRTLAADPGAVSITGTAADFLITRVLTADAGSVVINGTAASLLVTRTLAAAPGSVVITGTDATLTFQEDNTLSAESGAFVITGTPAALLVTRRIAADAGAFTITGQDADLRLATRLDAEAGAFTITGTAATLLVTRRIDAGAGAFTITGTDADLRLAAILSADAGSVTITGTDATFLATRRIVAQPGAFVITGTAAAFVLGGLVLPTPLPKNIATTAASGRTASTTAASRVVETV